MDRRLLVLRHAKSSWDTHGVPDHDRPLAPRGQDAVRRLSRHLTTAGVPVDLILCSSAVRAVQTLDGVRDALPGAVIEIEPGLYGIAAAGLITRLREIPDSVATVMVIGHNPGLEDLVGTLTATGDPDLIARVEFKYPTGGLAQLKLTSPWSGLTPASCHLESFVAPRDL
jgi:phosphohistidine phosphatase